MSVRKLLRTWIAIGLCLISANAHARYPIVFVHGFGVPSWIYKKPFSLPKLFAGWGYKVIVVDNPPVTTIHKAAARVARDIRQQLPTGKFHLVGHSQGGLTARLLAQSPEFRSRTLSVTALSAPNQGAVIANQITALWEAGNGALPAWAQEALEQVFGGKIEVVREVTTYNIGAFNQRTLDQSGVRYFSMGHYIPFPEWRHSHVQLLAGMAVWLKALGEGPNDGIVGAESSHWGEWLGDFPGDHWAESWPVPFQGKMIVDDVFQRVAKNLDKHWP